MPSYRDKLKKIKAFAMDVDGVLTDGSVLATQDGDLIRTFNAKDGFGMRMCKIKGYPVAIITGGGSDSIFKRVTGIGVEPSNVFLHARNKVPYFEQFLKENNLKAEEVAYGGDDIPDLEILRICGLSFCPSDAVLEVKEICDHVSLHPGGHGCVREVIEDVLKAHDDWHFEAEAHTKLF